MIAVDRNQAVNNDERIRIRRCGRKAISRRSPSMRGGGEALVATIGVTPGMNVLDLGCGDGTTAVPEAQAGATSSASISPRTSSPPGTRARRSGLDNLKFQWGDATNLADLADDSFDLVVSIFGAMFAPRPNDVAKEMVRVTRPGGRIVMGNWIPGDPTFVAQLLKISGAYSPPPPEGFVSPVTWGVEENVVERFGSAGIPAEQNIDCERVMFVFESPRTPAEYLEDFRDYYGPTMNAYAAASADGREDELHEELTALVDEHNTATDGGTRIEAAYLRVTVSV